jgi:hypothetical protein
MEENGRILPSWQSDQADMEARDLYKALVAGEVVDRLTGKHSLSLSEMATLLMSRVWHEEDEDTKAEALMNICLALCYAIYTDVEKIIEETTIGGT